MLQFQLGQWLVCLALFVAARSSIASTHFRIQQAYEMPPDIYPNTALFLEALNDDGIAFGIAVRDVGGPSANRWLLRYTTNGRIAWHLDIGQPTDLNPHFLYEGATPNGVFFGSYRHPNTPAGEISIEAMLVDEQSGLIPLPSLPNQRSAYLRGASADGRWTGGEISFYGGDFDAVIWGPDRTSMRTGPFFPTEFTNDGTAYGIDASTGFAATWTLQNGMQLLPPPPIGVDASSAEIATDLGLVHVVARNPPGNAQLRTHLIFDGTAYRILQNTPEGQTVVRGLNDDGWAVGYDEANGGARGALVWIDDVLYNLNDLTIDLPVDVTLTSAYAINNLGQITVSGFDGNYNPVAYLLMPIPEPTGTAILACAALPARRKRRRADRRIAESRGVKGTGPFRQPGDEGSCPLRVHDVPIASRRVVFWARPSPARRSRTIAAAPRGRGSGR